MTAHPNEPFDSLLCFSLYSAGHAMNRVYQPLLDEVGLTYPQYLVLVALWNADGATVAEIGKQVGLESNTLTPLLKRMEIAGLLIRNRSRQDQRRVMVSLTEKGKELEAKCSHIPGRILEASGLTAEEAKELTARIIELRKNLQTARSF